MTQKNKNQVFLTIIEMTIKNTKYIFTGSFTTMNNISGVNFIIFNLINRKTQYAKDRSEMES